MVGGLVLFATLLALATRHTARADLLANTTLPETQCDGSEAKGQSCWLASSIYPRQCDCVRNVCPRCVCDGWAGRAAEGWG